MSGPPCRPLRIVPLLPAMLWAAAAAAEPLFDGRTFTGWEGDTKATWRIEDGVIVAGSLDRRQAKNDFLCTARRFRDFELTLKVKLAGTEGFVNSGIQFRSERVPNHHEVSGYQADFGAGHDGGLYDESRRNRFLAKPSAETLKQASRPGEWNEYRIRAEGPRIRLWLNGVETVDYTETDPAIPGTGVVALQIHGNAVAEVRFKDIEIEELGPGTP